MEPQTTQERTPSDTQQTIVWGAFLATSWTWVIGMVLPVLLCPLFNFWGWLAFAIPNVIGAAAVGYFSYGRTEEEQESFIRRHLLALWTFSLVTALFQLFVVAWLVTRMVGPIGLIVYGALTALFMRGSLHDRRKDLMVTMVVFLISLALMCLFIMEDKPSWQHEGFFDLPISRAQNLLWLFSALCLGFLACPHMDLTLLRARNAVGPRLGRRVFTVGFGVFFLLMILFTLAYARALESLPAVPVLFMTSTLVAVTFHLISQAAATTALHLGEMRRRPVSEALNTWLPIGIAALGLLILAGAGRSGGVDPATSQPLPWWMMRGLGSVIPSAFGLDQGEVIYRAFLGFYAFIFPSYAWTAMFHAPADGPSMTRQAVSLALGLIAAGISSIGFFSNDFFWVFPGVVLILAGPGIARLVDR